MSFLFVEDQHTGRLFLSVAHLMAVGFVSDNWCITMKNDDA